MTDEENIRSMESKVQEIERLVAEVVDGDLCGMYSSCSNCPLKNIHPDKYGIRRRMCDIFLSVIMNRG